MARNRSRASLGFVGSGRGHRGERPAGSGENDPAAFRGRGALGVCRPAGRGSVGDRGCVFQQSGGDEHHRRFRQGLCRGRGALRRAHHRGNGCQCCRSAGSGASVFFDLPAVSLGRWLTEKAGPPDRALPVEKAFLFLQVVQILLQGDYDLLRLLELICRMVRAEGRVLKFSAVLGRKAIERMLMRFSFRSRSFSRRRSVSRSGIFASAEIARIHLPSVERPTPRSSAISRRVRPLVSASRTASRRNSGVGLFPFPIEHLLVPQSVLSAFSGQVQLLVRHDRRRIAQFSIAEQRVASKNSQSFDLAIGIALIKIR